MHHLRAVIIFLEAEKVAASFQEKKKPKSFSSNKHALDAYELEKKKQ